MILSHANSNEVSSSGLKDVTPGELNIRSGGLTVDADAALLDQTPGIAPALGKTHLDESPHQVGWFAHRSLRDLFRKLSLSKLGLEICLRPYGRILAMQSLDQLARQ